MDALVLRLFDLVDPTINIPCLTEIHGVRLFSSERRPYPELDVLAHLPPLPGLRVILGSKSPIAVPETITGWYHEVFRVIWVRTGDRSMWEVRRSLLHECGHGLWGTLTPSARRIFDRSTAQCRGGWNDWNDPEERFADAIAVIVLNTAQTRADHRIVSSAQKALNSCQPFKTSSPQTAWLPSVTTALRPDITKK